MGLLVDSPPHRSFSACEALTTLFKIDTGVAGDLWQHNDVKEG